MQIKEITVEILEMTREEETALWDTPFKDMRVLGRKVVNWNTSDGNNDITLENVEGAGWGNATCYAIRVVG